MTAETRIPDTQASPFSGLTQTDDVALLANLLSQTLDSDPDMVTAYDEKTNADYGIEDVLRYIRGKYGENF